MKKLRIAFSKARSKLAILSYLIRLVEKVKFSHALLRWHSETLKQDLVYQASHGMSHFLSGTRFDIGAETIAEYEIELTEEQHIKVMQKCVELAGIKYGYFQLAGMAFERLTGLKHPFRDGSKTYVCSELVGEVLRQVHEINIDLELVGPGRLEKLVASLPEVKRVK